MPDEADYRKLKGPKSRSYADCHQKLPVGLRNYTAEARVPVGARNRAGRPCTNELDVQTPLSSMTEMGGSPLWNWRTEMHSLLMVEGFIENLVSVSLHLQNIFHSENPIKLNNNQNFFKNPNNYEIEKLLNLL